MKFAPVIALLAGLPTLAAQRSKPEKTDVLVLIDQAEKSMKAGAKESATRSLLRAERGLLEELRGELHDSLQRTISGLLTKSDSHRTQWVAAFDKSAGQLIKTSQRYRRRKWSRIADQLLMEAESLSPTLVAKERAKKGRATSKNKSEKRAKKSSGPDDLLPKFHPDYGWKWDAKTGVIESPPLETATHHILGSVQCSKDATVSLDVKRPDTPSQAGVIFGGKDYEDYFILDLVFYEGSECRALAYRWKAPSLVEIGTQSFFLAKEKRRDWISYAVRIEGKQATFFVDEKRMFSATCDRAPLGKIGMLISGISKYKGPVQYRKLLIYQPKDESAAAAKNADTQPLLRKIAEAEALIKTRKNEDATLTLLGAARQVDALDNDTVRKTLSQAIHNLIQRADRSNARYVSARVAAGAPLIELAKVYADANWFHLAGDVLKCAERLDKPATFALRAAIDDAQNAEASKPTTLASAATNDAVGGGKSTRGLPAEAQEPTRNLDLLLWFEGGRQPFDKDAWRVSTQGVAAPVDRLGGTLIVSTGDFSEKAAFRVQVKTTDKECVAGVAFGFKTVYSYYYMAWRHDEKKGVTYVQLYRVKGSDTKRVGPTKTFRFSANARKSWMTARVAIGDNKISLKLGNAPEFVVPVQTAGLTGRIGLHTVVLDNRQQVHFRNLVVEKN